MWDKYVEIAVAYWTDVMFTWRMFKNSPLLTLTYYKNYIFRLFKLQSDNL
jgi:hypothetical protein